MFTEYSACRVVHHRRFSLPSWLPVPDLGRAQVSTAGAQEKETVSTVMASGVDRRGTAWQAPLNLVLSTLPVAVPRSWADDEALSTVIRSTEQAPPAVHYAWAAGQRRPALVHGWPA